MTPTLANPKTLFKVDIIAAPPNDGNDSLVYPSLSLLMNNDLDLCCWRKMQEAWQLINSEPSNFTKWTTI